MASTAEQSKISTGSGKGTLRARKLTSREKRMQRLFEEQNNQNVVVYEVVGRSGKAARRQ